MKKYQIIITLLPAFITLAMSPPADDARPSQHRWHRVGHNGDIRALCRVGDSLWVGTGNGVFIYDLGSEEISGHVTLGPRLPSNSVRAISTRQDSVFVGTDAGMSVYAPDTALVFTPARPGPYPGPALSLIRHIDFGLSGTLYLSTYGGGLGVFDGDSSWVVTRADSLLDDKVYGMVQEDDTTFYFATSMGLCAFRDSLWVNFQAGAGLPRAEIRRIIAWPEVGHYLLVGGRGVYRFDGYRARRISSPTLFAENAIADIALDARGDLWAVGGHGGVAVYRNGHWTRVDRDGGVPGDHRWNCAYADSAGGVFFGSADGNVLAIQDEVVGGFRLPRGLPSGRVDALATDSTGALYALNGSYIVRIVDDIESFEVDLEAPVVVSIAVSPLGELWVASRWGIYRRDGDRYVEFDTHESTGLSAGLSERAPVFSAIGFDPSGSLWVGTQSGNIHRFDGEIWMRLADADESGAGTVKAFTADAWGRMWATGSRGTVAAYKEGRWTTYGPPAFGDQAAVSILLAPTGAPVLTTDQGVWGFDEVEGWKTLQFAAAGEDSAATGTIWDPAWPRILSADLDDDGRLYVGTEGGLAVINESGARWITFEDGLGGKSVTSVFVDDGNVLWVGFRTNGLARIPLEESELLPERH